jgi:MFS family permease
MSSNVMGTVAAIAGAVLSGMMLALLGLFKGAVARAGTVGPSRRLPLLFAFLNLFLVPAVLLVGAAVDRWGARGVMLTGTIGLSLAFFIFSAGPTGRQLFAAILLAALGGAAVSVSAIVLAGRVFFSREEAVASVALACVFMALGAGLIPPLGALFRHALGDRRTFLLMAFVCLLPGFPLLLARPGDLDLTQAREGLPSLVEQQRVWLAAVVFFFYAPLEAAISLRTSAHLVDFEKTQARAAWSLSAFWTAFAGSRLLLALSQHNQFLNIISPRHNAWVLIVPAVLTVVLLGNLASNDDRSRSRFGVILLGLVLGPIYPTLTGIVLQECSHEQGTAIAMLFAVGSLGSLLAAPVFGRRPTNAAPETAVSQENRAALLLPLLLALALGAAILLFVLAEGF